VRCVGERAADERRGTVVPLGERAGVAQQAQVVADARLRETERARELANGELGPLEQREHPQARRIAEEAQALGKGLGVGPGRGRDHAKHNIMKS
jgi:hypothetical protein